jgi:hypothetical protein
MTICILAFRVDSLTYTIAKALTYGGYDVLLQVVEEEYVCDLDSNLLKKLDSIDRVTVNISEISDSPARFHHLIVQGNPKLLKHHSLLDALAKRSDKLTIITTGDRKSPYRQAIMKQWQEIRWYGRKLLQADRVVYKDGFYPVDLMGPFLRRSVIGFDVHSKFLHDQVSFQQIHTRDWDIKKQRPILANFLGCRDPQRRASIVDSVRPLFFQADGETPNVVSDKKLFWHEYSDDRPSALGLAEYLDILSQSDFTLCPPGYSLVTHRPLEAMLRGSIPVLNSNELDLYDIDLEDGVNCITADPGGWPAAIDRLFQMDESDIIAIRNTIFSILPDKVAYPASSRQMRIRLGLDH